MPRRNSGNARNEEAAVATAERASNGHNYSVMVTTAEKGWGVPLMAKDPCLAAILALRAFCELSA